MLQIHIGAGLLAILAGFVALFSPKGQRLWRMTIALFIATGSFFLGQAEVLPERAIQGT